MNLNFSKVITDNQVVKNDSYIEKLSELRSVDRLKYLLKAKEQADQPEHYFTHT